VRKKQEKELTDPDVTRTVWVARDDEVTTKRVIAPGEEADVGDVEIKVGELGDEDEDDLDEDLAASIFASAKKVAAANLSLDDILEDEAKYKAFKLFCVKRSKRHAGQGSNEESIVFLHDVAEVKRVAGNPALAVEKRCEAVFRSAGRIMDRFFAEDSDLQLSGVTDVVATKASTNMIWKTLSNTYAPDQAIPTGMAEASASVLSGIFDSPFAQMSVFLSDKVLPAFRKALGKSESVNKASAKASASNKTRIVVVGGGACGITVARYFDQYSADIENIHLTLIDPKEYYEDTTYQPISFCDPEEAWPKSALLYKGGAIQNGTLVTGKISGIDTEGKFVRVGQDGTIVPYDYLAICCGSSYASGIKTDNASIDYRRKQIQSEFKSYKRSDHICVVGGGLVALEIGCEIKEKCPDTKVTYVTRGTRLLRRAAPAANEKAQAYLKELGIDLITGDPMVSTDHGLGEVVLKSGRVIEADKIILATGYTPNSDWVKTNKEFAPRHWITSDFSRSTPTYAFRAVTVRSLPGAISAKTGHSIVTGTSRLSAHSTWHVFMHM